MYGADLAVLVVPFLDGSSNRVEAGTDLEAFNSFFLSIGCHDLKSSCDAADWSMLTEMSFERHLRVSYGNFERPSSEQLFATPRDTRFIHSTYEFSFSLHVVFNACLINGSDVGSHRLL